VVRYVSPLLHADASAEVPDELEPLLS
jgi:hypothetical protein